MVLDGSVRGETTAPTTSKMHDPSEVKVFSYIVLRKYGTHNEDLVVSFEVIDSDDAPVNCKIECDDRLLLEGEQTCFPRIDRVDRCEHDTIRGMAWIESDHLKDE